MIGSVSVGDSGGKGREVLVRPLLDPVPRFILFTGPDHVRLHRRATEAVDGPAARDQRSRDDRDNLTKRNMEITQVSCQVVRCSGVLRGLLKKKTLGSTQYISAKG